MLLSVKSSDTKLLYICNFLNLLSTRYIYIFFSLIENITETALSFTALIMSYPMLAVSWCTLGIPWWQALETVALGVQWSTYPLTL